MFHGFGTETLSNPPSNRKGRYWTELSGIYVLLPAKKPQKPGLLRVKEDSTDWDFGYHRRGRLGNRFFAAKPIFIATEAGCGGRFNEGLKIGASCRDRGRRM